MGERLFPSGAATGESYKKETGDGNLETLHLTPQLAEDGYAANWHPTSTTHEKASNQVAEKLREMLGIS